MHHLGTIEEARYKVLTDTRKCLERIRHIAATSFSDADAGVRVLQQVRAETYEDLNQIQHEHLILCAVEWLVENGVCHPQTEWQWNPRQTGDHTEPDLLGSYQGSRVISAEITTSSKPDGVIDTRMRRTLSKLSTQTGSLFYFVRTSAMANRAATKIRKNGWNIRVVQLAQGAP